MKESKKRCKITKNICRTNELIFLFQKQTRKNMQLIIIIIIATRAKEDNRNYKIE